ncbi:hypothetical protein PPACK8108_LOCUS3125 [Phakopsora pachyrhizi]|uniref:Meiotically up-regulated protein Msb1/Mug8 domain-containing protein n=1 Tax=Phakopsora pachyrhizi TaxID=170000 RepID=A0AAV0AJD1_PHAPC|nr:hypothetical protein PPACK8108_LOCUS3125 [Phakopsora pachyrhizi]
MHSIFKPRGRKKKSNNQNDNTSLPSKQLNTSKSLPSLSNSPPVSSHSTLPPLPSPASVARNAQPRIDEFGRPLVNPPPAFTLASQRYNHQQNNLNQINSFNSSEKELQLMYGYIGLFTEIELDLTTTLRSISLVTQQIKSRGLETPMLFSIRALDISVQGSHSLIRCFVNDHSEFQRDLHISTPHNLSAFLKWCLARYVNLQGLRGVLGWDKYASWREAERARYISSDLLGTLPPHVSQLLIILLDLFATVSAYSHLNGMTVHKCAAIFGGFIFGLEDDLSFEETYSNWLKYSHATEHLILAHIRDMKATCTTGQLPSRMEASILGYPNIIPSLTKTHPSARLEKVARFKRFTRFYNKNLILNGANWEIEGSSTWDRLLPYQNSKKSQADQQSRAKPKFSKLYKHILNIDDDFFEETMANESELDIDLSSQQRFKSLVEKEWSGFITKGFQEPDSKKLEFDLTESERSRRKQKHDTMDWDSFAGNGFLGRETYLPNDLNFNTDFTRTVSVWPEEKKVLSKKLIKTNKSLPAFPYDIRPVEENSIYVDENFFESWADVLIGSGWTRDEFKKVSWAIVNFKSKPSRSLDLQLGSHSTDGRVDDLWVLFEEVVPPEYRDELIENGQKITGTQTKKSRRISFLKAMTRRDPKKSSNLNNALSSDARMATIREGASMEYYPSAPQKNAGTSIFSNLERKGTKKITLSPSITSTDTRSIFSVTPSVGHASQPYSNSENINHTKDGFSDFHNQNHALPYQQAASDPPNGFMADFRARAKKRQANYKIGKPSQPDVKLASEPLTEIKTFDHETHSLLEEVDLSVLGKKGREPWVNVLSREPEEGLKISEGIEEVVDSITPHPMVAIDGSESSGSSDETRNFDRPINPSPPASSRAVTPITEPEIRVEEYSQTSSPRKFEGHHNETQEESYMANEKGDTLSSFKPPPSPSQVKEIPRRIPIGQRKESLSNLTGDQSPLRKINSKKPNQFEKPVLKDPTEIISNLTVVDMFEKSEPISPQKVRTQVEGGEKGGTFKAGRK